MVPKLQKPISYLRIQYIDADFESQAHLGDNFWKKLFLIASLQLLCYTGFLLHQMKGRNQ
jgi:hypothetical protein